MDRKVVLCRCEDVTAHDVTRAVATGFDSLEEVKRYTGFGTGPCQGKDCLRLVAEHLAKLTDRPIHTLQPFTSRPPLHPVPLAALTPRTRGTPADKPTPAPVPSREGPRPPLSTSPGSSSATRRRQASRGSYEIAIVGGGIMGLALAYELACQGQSNVVVLEGRHLAWGASGRNGGGVRQQWSSALNIQLMQESVRICKSLAQRLRTNIWMRQGGYLFLATTAARVQRMEKNVALQNEHGVATRMIDVDEARRIVPALCTDGVRGACYNPTDGIVFPWPFLWGYAAAAEAKGVHIETFCPVTAMDARADGYELHTPRGTYQAHRVVNAAGAWSPEVARLLDVHLPTWPARHEILSTEALKPFLDPMVSVMDTGLYASQSLRGEVVGGITLHEHDAPGNTTPIALGSRLTFLRAMGAALTALLPQLGSVKVVRQWAGPYDHSPDGSPLLGEVPGRPGFFVCCGFVGHGFMMAPVVARHYARHLLGKATHPIFRAWRPSRFAEGEPVTEDWNIG